MTDELAGALEQIAQPGISGEMQTTACTVYRTALLSGSFKVGFCDAEQLDPLMHQTDVVTASTRGPHTKRIRSRRRTGQLRHRNQPGVRWRAYSAAFDQPFRRHPIRILPFGTLIECRQNADRITSEYA